MKDQLFFQVFLTHLGKNSNFFSYNLFLIYVNPMIPVLCCVIRYISFKNVMSSISLQNAFEKRIQTKYAFLQKMNLEKSQFAPVSFTNRFRSTLQQSNSVFHLKILLQSGAEVQIHSSVHISIIVLSRMHRPLHAKYSV